MLGRVRARVRGRPGPAFSWSEAVQKHMPKGACVILKYICMYVCACAKFIYTSANLSQRASNCIS